MDYSEMSGLLSEDGSFDYSQGGYDSNPTVKVDFINTTAKSLTKATFSAQKGLMSSPKKAIRSLVRMNSRELLKSCAPKIFRRRSTEYILNKKSRESRSQSPASSRKYDGLKPPTEIGRRLSDCGPITITKSGFAHNKFTDPYFNCNLLSADINTCRISSNIDNPDSIYGSLHPNGRGPSISFDKDEINSEVQELPSYMPRRKSRTGIFDDIYSSFNTTRKLRIVHQLSMDETRSDVYVDITDLANSQSIDDSPPLPYVGDVDGIIPCNSKRKKFSAKHPFSAPTSIDCRTNIENPSLSYCLDTALGTATLVSCEVGE